MSLVVGGGDLVVDELSWYEGREQYEPRGLWNFSERGRTWIGLALIMRDIISPQPVGATKDVTVKQPPLPKSHPNPAAEKVVLIQAIIILQQGSLSHLCRSQ